jgi:hypothetical protein
MKFYKAILLRDLTFLAEGNDIYDSKGQMNEDTMALLIKYISDIQVYQKELYTRFVFEVTLEQHLARLYHAGIVNYISCNLNKHLNR